MLRLQPAVQPAVLVEILARENFRLCLSSGADALGGLGGFGWMSAGGQKERGAAVKAYAHAGCSLSSGLFD